MKRRASAVSPNLLARKRTAFRSLPIAFWVLTAWQTALATPSVAGATSTGDLTRASQPLLDGSLSNANNVVGVRASRNGETRLCTGALLLPNLVLTARHCLTVNASSLANGDCANATIAPPDELTEVTVVASNDVDQAAAEQTHVVAEAWLADDGAKLCGQDLALLRLVSPITSKSFNVTTEVPEPKTTFTVYGYGLSGGDHGRQRVNEGATVNCVGAACNDSRIAANELLANAGACEGDSGGPALDKDGNVFALTARSSSDCNETAFVTFVDHVTWLAEAVRQASNEGQYEIPSWATLPKVDPAAPTPSKSKPLALHAGGGCSVGVVGRNNVAVWLFWLFTVGAALTRRISHTGTDRAHG